MLRPVSLAPLIATFAVAVAWSSSTTAEVYKWVDEKGVTNYSGTPPARGKAQTLDPGTVTVSVYQAPSPQETARALDAMMRQRIARLENELLAERLSRLTQQASHQTDRLAHEQCLNERRVDCDAGRDGVRAIPYFYAAAAPVYVVGRAFPVTTFTPFPRTPPFTTMARFSQPAVVSARTADRLSRKHR